MPDTLDILYQDQQLVAINKPAGLLVHRSNIDRHESRFALQLLRDQLGQHVYPVHRLDKPTSGVLLFALSSETAAVVSKSFSNNSIKKSYLTIVRGYSPKHGTIDHALKKQFDKMTDNKRQKEKPAQSAITHFSQLATIELPFAVDRYPQTRYSLVEARPDTGRKHQLRRHFKHIAHPIIGDPKHGKSTHNRFFNEQYGVARLLLHAQKLTFNHPETGQTLSIKAAFDDDFKKLLDEFDWLKALD